jgi:6-phosphogluconolactonase (cycloisomerase 2 family)
MSERRTTGSILILILPMLLVGCGGSTNPPSMPAPTASARFALVSNLFDNIISSYAIDSQTGQLIAKDTVATGGTNSGVIAIAPSGRFAYVANIVSNDISVFSINADTGSLASVGSPVPAGSDPRFIVFGPARNVLYVVNQDSDHITGFSIDPEQWHPHPSHWHRSDGRCPGRTQLRSLGPLRVRRQLQFR